MISNPKFKKFIIGGGVLIALFLVSCGLTGCDLFKKHKGDQPASSTTPLEISGLPPDPSEAGKATLAGIDSDNDGVRDDIQRYIAMTYPNSAKTRAALTQYVKVVQNALLDANDKQKSVKHGEEDGQATTCLGYIHGSVEAGRRVRLDLVPVILNTDARNKAYFTYNDQLGGEVFHGIPYSERASACSFDVATLPN